VANGKPGDHPLTDVLVWGSDHPFTEYPAYTERIVTLIGEIDRLGRRDAFAAVEDLIWETRFTPRKQPELHEGLVALRDRRSQAAECA